MSQIITNTPIWVFALFFFLIFLGLSQIKKRDGYRFYLLKVFIVSLYGSLL